MNFKLPEPNGFILETKNYGLDAEEWTTFELRQHKWDEDCDSLYTEAHLKQALRDVLEEAASVALHINDNCSGAPDGPEEISAAIRTMIGEIN